VSVKWDNKTKAMDPTLQLIMEQLREVNNSISAVISGQEELKTVSTELKTELCAPSSELKTDISAVSVVLKTDIIAVQDKIVAMQEQLKNDIQDEINAIKQDLKTEVSDLTSRPDRNGRKSHRQT
jgi:gas vesicle protein